MVVSAVKMVVLWMIAALAAVETIRGQVVTTPCPFYAPYYCACNLSEQSEIKLLKMCLYGNYSQLFCQPCSSYLQDYINYNACPGNVYPTCSVSQFGQQKPSPYNYITVQEKLFTFSQKSGRLTYLPPNDLLFKTDQNVTQFYHNTTSVTSRNREQLSTTSGSNETRREVSQHRVVDRQGMLSKSGKVVDNSSMSPEVTPQNSSSTLDIMMPGMFTHKNNENSILEAENWKLFGESKNYIAKRNSQNIKCYSVQYTVYFCPSVDNTSVNTQSKAHSHQFPEKSYGPHRVKYFLSQLKLNDGDLRVRLSLKVCPKEGNLKSSAGDVYPDEKKIERNAKNKCFLNRIQDTPLSDFGTVYDFQCSISKANIKFVSLVEDSKKSVTVLQLKTDFTILASDVIHCLSNSENKLFIIKERKIDISECNFPSLRDMTLRNIENAIYKNFGPSIEVNLNETLMDSVEIQIVMRIEFPTPLKPVLKLLRNIFINIASNTFLNVTGVLKFKAFLHLKKNFTVEEPKSNRNSFFKTKQDLLYILLTCPSYRNSFALDPNEVHFRKNTASAELYPEWTKEIHLTPLFRIRFQEPQDRKIKFDHRANALTGTKSERLSAKYKSGTKSKDSIFQLCKVLSVPQTEWKAESHLGTVEPEFHQAKKQDFSRNINVHGGENMEDEAESLISRDSNTEPHIKNMLEDKIEAAMARQDLITKDKFTREKLEDQGVGVMINESFNKLKNFEEKLENELADVRISQGWNSSEKLKGKVGTMVNKYWNIKVADGEKLKHMLKDTINQGLNTMLLIRRKLEEEILGKANGTESETERADLWIQRKLLQTEQIGEVEENVIYVTIRDSNRRRRETKPLVQDSWCSLRNMFRRGDMQCTIWSYKKLCSLKCHKGCTFGNKSEVVLKCDRKNGNWEPSMASCKCTDDSRNEYQNEIDTGDLYQDNNDILDSDNKGMDNYTGADEYKSGSERYEDAPPLTKSGPGPVDTSSHYDDSSYSSEEEYYDESEPIGNSRDSSTEKNGSGGKPSNKVNSPSTNELPQTKDKETENSRIPKESVEDYKPGNKEIPSHDDEEYEDNNEQSEYDEESEYYDEESAPEKNKTTTMKRIPTPSIPSDDDE